MEFETREFVVAKFKRSMVSAGMVLGITMIGAGPTRSQLQFPPPHLEKFKMTQPKFYCNTNALNPAERTQHKALTETLIANRKNSTELPQGYEFQFSPSTVSLTELAKWVATESKCCPFFDFHIDFEREGRLLCLRLTGAEGIKPFIRAEFQVRPR